MYNLKFKNTTNRYSKQELFDNIETVWNFKKSQPFLSDIQIEPSKICFGTYFNRFGSWKNALIEFVKYKNGEIKLEELNKPKKSRTKLKLFSLIFDINELVSSSVNTCPVFNLEE